MTLTLEMAPEIQRALAEKATRLGVPVEDYALEVLRRDLKNESNVASTRDAEPSYFSVIDALRADRLENEASRLGDQDDFLARAQALDARLEATGSQGVDSAQIIREARAERAARFFEGADDD